MSSSNPVAEPCNLSALYSQLNGRPLWTSAAITQANALSKTLKTLRPGARYNVLNIDGTEQELEVPSPNDDEQLAVILKGYHDLAMHMDKNGKFGDGKEAKVLYKIDTISKAHIEKEECKAEEGDPPWVHYMRKWERGEVLTEDGKYWDKSIGVKGRVRWEWKDDTKRPAEDQQEAERISQIWKSSHDKLVHLLQSHKDVLEHVDQVLCFALGAPSVQRSRTWVQHLAAWTVDQQLRIMRAGRSYGFVFDGLSKTIVQDPNYCDRCTELLRSGLRIDAVTDLSAFEKITNKTFVMCIAPSAPIMQVIGDLAAAGRAPLAMLCEAIDDDVLKFERDPTGQTYDESTANLVAYKKACTEEDFGDFQDIMETTSTKKDFKMPKLAVQLGPSASAEERRASVLAHRRALRVNFGELKLYVRKT